MHALTSARHYGEQTEKRASLGFDNQWVSVNTAVDVNAKPTLLIRESEFSGLNITVTPDTKVYFDGKTYQMNHLDRITNTYTFTLTATTDIHEGLERMDTDGPAVVGRIGLADEVIGGGPLEQNDPAPALN